MNDYIFTIEVSISSTVRQEKIVVNADNVEVAYDKAKNKVSKDYVIRGLVDVKKL